jgi:hypothetical protein
MRRDMVTIWGSDCESPNLEASRSSNFGPRGSRMRRNFELTKLWKACSLPALHLSSPCCDERNWWSHDQSVWPTKGFEAENHLREAKTIEDCRSWLRGLPCEPIKRIVRAISLDKPLLAL